MGFSTRPRPRQTHRNSKEITSEAYDVSPISNSDRLIPRMDNVERRLDNLQPRGVDKHDEQLKQHNKHLARQDQLL